MHEQADVLLVDDMPLVRGGLRMMLEGQSGIRIVGEAENGVDAIRAARIHKPDVVLMDVSMPGMTGIEAMRLMLSEPELAHVKVIVLSVHADDETVFDALRSGASGYMLKDSRADILLDAVRTVSAGHGVLAPPLTNRLFREIVSRPAISASSGDQIDRLTSRETDVFKLLACGYRNDEIAAALVVGESTVKSHIQRIYEKLGVHDRVEVVIYAYENGYIRPGHGGRSVARAS
nr:response regulator transcription factor [Kibdelosporangium sp. MJ126-NF4]CEL19967.1 DNA-binding response regulator, LuxR family [Kibdelosporangium sp. MJ126-NF4]CTQ97191.1 DNA-binding response regulator, LuxR family [Kibdelosporangium sp. MJ126-NF4]